MLQIQKEKEKEKEREKAEHSSSSYTTLSSGILGILSEVSTEKN